MDKLEWWGYLHISGTIHAKRYFSEQDIDDAIESPFVHTYCPPFMAENREEALKILEEYFKEDYVNGY